MPWERRDTPCWLHGAPACSRRWRTGWHWASFRARTLPTPRYWERWPVGVLPNCDDAP